MTIEMGIIRRLAVRVPDQVNMHRMFALMGIKFQVNLDYWYGKQCPETLKLINVRKREPDVW